MFFDSSIEALRASRIKAAELKMEARIGERSIPIIGGLWSNIKLGVNYASRFVTVPVAFFLPTGAISGTKPGETPPAPVLPKEFEGTELGENLQKAYKQETEIADGKAASAKSLVRLDVVGYKRNKALATHAAARAEKVTLPEEENRSGFAGGALAGIGAATLGQLTPSSMNGIKDMAKSLLEGVRA